VRPIQPWSSGRWQLLREPPRDSLSQSRDRHRILNAAPAVATLLSRAGLNDMELTSIADPCASLGHEVTLAEAFENELPRRQASVCIIVPGGETPKGRQSSGMGGMTSTETSLHQTVQQGRSSPPLLESMALSIARLDLGVFVVVATCHIILILTSLFWCLTFRRPQP